MPTTARLAAVLSAAAVLAIAAPASAGEPPEDVGSAATGTPGPTPSGDADRPSTAQEATPGAPSPECREDEHASARSPSRSGHPILGALKGVGVVLYVCVAAYPVSTILCVGLAAFAPWAAVAIVGTAMLIGAATYPAPQEPAKTSRERCGQGSQGAPPRGGPAADPPWPQAPTPDVPLAGASFDGPVPAAQWAS